MDYEVESPSLVSSEGHPLLGELVDKNEEELWDYLTLTLHPRENEQFGSENNTAEHKLIFLTGPLIGIDIADARTSLGSPIYSNRPNHSKIGEVLEAIAAINFYTEGHGTLVRAVSEVTDVIYNLVMLTELDHDYAPQYKKSLQFISDSMGISTRNFLLLAAVKYSYRMVNWGTKSPNAEDLFMTDLMSDHVGTDGSIIPAVIPTPEFTNIDQTLNLLEIIQSKYLKPRLDVVVWESLRGIQYDTFDPEQ